MFINVRKTLESTEDVVEDLGIDRQKRSQPTPMLSFFFKLSIVGRVDFIYLID